MEVKPIGIIHSPFQQPAGTPVQPVFAKGSEGLVVVFDEYAQGLKDLDGFERIWLIYWFDRCRHHSLTVTPYMDTEERGLFATRAPARPNPIGMSPVRLERIERNTIYVSQIDILDGTPLLDIKPYSPQLDCFEVSRNGWLQDTTQGNHKADRRFHE
ncbi:MAG: tRNA (N6-threonylcarbamoyladenosine(37)-N6)-methyltransferase TrmO [Planctomycetota bacterium]|jgi:tRNA-Thr(GGU) m(6)t(6)A37 methyltransferase TsaA